MTPSGSFSELLEELVRERTGLAAERRNPASARASSRVRWRAPASRARRRTSRSCSAIRACSTS